MAFIDCSFELLRLIFFSKLLFKVWIPIKIPNTNDDDEINQNNDELITSNIIDIYPVPKKDTFFNIKLKIENTKYPVFINSIIVSCNDIHITNKINDMLNIHDDVNINNNNNLYLLRARCDKSKSNDIKISINYENNRIKKIHKNIYVME